MLYCMMHLKFVNGTEENISRISVKTKYKIEQNFFLNSTIQWREIGNWPLFWKREINKVISIALIENDDLGDWNPEDCCWWLTFWQPVKSYLQSQWLAHRFSKRQSPTTVFLRTPVTQMIIFNRDMLLLGSNHFLNQHCLKISQKLMYSINEQFLRAHGH